MTPSPLASRRRTRGLAALVAAGAAMGALAGQAAATEVVQLPPDVYVPKTLEVTKTAHTFHAAYWKWDIEKTPSTRVGYNHENNHVKVGYKVTATPKVVRTGSHKVYGEIHMRNPSKYWPVAILGVYDKLDGAECRIGLPDQPNGTAANDVENGEPKLYLQPEGRKTVRYLCYFEQAPDKLRGKNIAIVKWAYAPRVIEPEPVEVASIASLDEPAMMLKIHHTPAYAYYNFYKGEIEHRGYTSAKVLDKMGDGRPEVLAESISALDGPWSHSYYKYLRAPERINECVRYKNRAILIGRKAEAVQNGVEVLSDWGRVHADAYVKICTKERRTPSSEDPPEVVVTEGSSEDPKPGTPAPRPKPGDVKPSDFDPKDPPSSEDPRPGKGKLHVTKRANKRVAYVGSKVVWTIRVKNTGDKVLRNVHVRDILPAHFRMQMKRTRQLMSSRKRGVSLKKRRAYIRIAYLKPGQTRTLRIQTKIVARPKLNKPVRVAASKKRGKARRVYIQRMKRGIACNIVIARSGRTADRDIACIRVLKPRIGPKNDEVEVVEDQT